MGEIQVLQTQGAMTTAGQGALVGIKGIGVKDGNIAILTSGEGNSQALKSVDLSQMKNFDSEAIAKALMGANPGVNFTLEQKEQLKLQIAGLKDQIVPHLNGGEAVVASLAEMLTVTPTANPAHTAVAAKAVEAHATTATKTGELTNADAKLALTSLKAQGGEFAGVNVEDVQLQAATLKELQAQREAGNMAAVTDDSMLNAVKP